MISKFAWMKKWVDLLSFTQEIIAIFLAFGAFFISYLSGFSAWVKFFVLLMFVIMPAVILWMIYRRQLRYVPLEQAAKYAYEKLEVEDSLLTKAAERMHDKASPEKAVGFMKDWLSQNLLLYGIKPPSRAFLLIPSDYIQRGRINGEVLQSFDPKKLPYTNLSVDRPSLRRLVRDRIKESRKHN